MVDERARQLRDRPRSFALRLLGIRQRSCEELRRRLREKGFVAADVEGVVAELAAAGLLDDAQFARSLIESELRRKPVGRRWLGAKLSRHLVPPAVADEALADLLPPERERALARSAAEQQLATRRRQHTAEHPPRVLPLARFLSARGFPSEVVADILLASESDLY